MTSEPPSPATVVFLLADHQAGVVERVIKAPPRVRVEPNALALAPATLHEPSSTGLLNPLLAA